MTGLAIVTLGLVLVALGVLWRGWAVRPLSAKRSRAAMARARSRRLLRAADLAITLARRRAAPDEPVIVRVDDVLTMAAERFGTDDASPEQAAAALRRRYNVHRCHSDCMTDAFD